MYLEYMPHCCTARVAVDFGQSGTAEGGSHQISPEYLKSKIRQGVVTQKARGDACMIATTNNEQTVANAVLRELGFQCSGPMSKKQHSQTQVILWWLPYDQIDLRSWGKGGDV